HRVLADPPQGPNGEHVAAVRVADRQRVTAVTVQGAPPTLEVDGPQVIWLRDEERWRVRGGERRARSTSTAHDEPCFFEHALDGLPRGRSTPVLALEQTRELLRPPRRALTAQLDDLLNHRHRRLQRRRVRPRRTIGQPSNASLLEAAEPFVPGLATDPEL